MSFWKKMFGFETNSIGFKKDLNGIVAPKITEPNPYKKLETKRFALEITPEVQKLFPTLFEAIAVCEPSSNAKYNVNIYSLEGQLIAPLDYYTTGESKQLFDTIATMNEGKVYCWGEVSLYHDNNTVISSVDIPIGANKEQIDLLKIIIKKCIEYRKIDDWKSLQFDELIKFANSINEIEVLLKANNYKFGEYNIFDFHFYNPPKLLLTSLSKQLEMDENWQALVELASLRNYLDIVPSNKINAIHKRIEKAQKICESKNKN